MCMYISLTIATACKYDILIDTVRTQSIVITDIRVYLAEGPMPRASEAPFAPDIVRCSKSWTTVDAGWYSQCSLTNGNREEDALLFHERSPERRCRTSSRGIAPQKPNRRTPRARFAGGRAFRRHVLSRQRARRGTGRGKPKGEEGLMKDFLLYACGREGETKRQGLA